MPPFRRFASFARKVLPKSESDNHGEVLELFMFLQGAKPGFLGQGFNANALDYFALIRQYGDNREIRVDREDNVAVDARHLNDASRHRFSGQRDQLGFLLGYPVDCLGDFLVHRRGRSVYRLVLRPSDALARIFGSENPINVTTYVCSNSRKGREHLLSMAREYNKVCRDYDLGSVTPEVTRS
jgi:hypothetical protein